MTLSPDQIAAAKGRDLRQLAAKWVDLRRAGTHMVGCCPFHKERSASFHVYTDRAHCFGCGWHGDAIDFLMAMEKRSFVSIVADLAPPSVGTLSQRSPQNAIRPRTAVMPRLVGRTHEAMGLCSDGGWAAALARRYSLGMWWVERAEDMPQCRIDPVVCHSLAVFAIFADDIAPALRAIELFDAAGIDSWLERVGGAADGGTSWPKSRNFHNDG